MPLPTRVRSVRGPGTGIARPRTGVEPRREEETVPISHDHATGPAEPPERYEIRVRDELDPHWSAWFDSLELRSEPDGVTVLAGPVADQAALHGLLAKLHDLGLRLLSVRRIDPDQEQ
jgi:hypothetical protein